MASTRRISAIQSPLLRSFATRVLLEYRRSGSASQNENLKHVLRMVWLLRGHADELKALGCDPEILELGILVSDLGKEPHLIQKYLAEYGNDSFRVFMDHARVSMREGNLIRKELGVSNETWRKVLRSIIGHDGPSIEGSWWKENYESQLDRRYPRLRTLEGLIHCYLDRMDQGGVFRGRGNQLNGGLRKISYDLFSKGPLAGRLGPVVQDIFGPTREGTRRQLEHLDQVEKPRFFGRKPLPVFLQVHRADFDRAEHYSHCIEVLPEDPESVLIRLGEAEAACVRTLDEFWRTLSKVTLESPFLSPLVAENTG